MLPKGGEVVVNGTQTPREAAQYRLEATHPGSPAPRPDLPGYTHFVRTAEDAGLDSILISISRYEPDPMVTAAALGMVTEKLRYIVAYRTGLIQPASFVQQINTLSGFLNGRVSFNVVAGSSPEEQHSYGDFLGHDDRYARAGEFLEICNELWSQAGPVNYRGKYYQMENGAISTPWQSPDRDRPEIFVSGHSQVSKDLAAAQASCWLRVLDTPEKIASEVAEMRSRGLEVCLRMGIICRPSRVEVLEVIDQILDYIYEKDKKLNLPNRLDSQMYREAAAAPEGAWLNENIWAGFKPFCGPVWTTLAGKPDELAQALLEYKKIGVTQFILSGWPEVDEVEIFGREILPLIRAAEE